MDVDVQYRPGHAMARVSLAEGESVVAHSGAMVGMSTNVAVEATSAGLRQGITPNYHLQHQGQLQV